MRLTALRVKNYGCLADFELSDIGPLAIFVGANGSGKSTLFDVFAFLRDALRDDIRTALAHRGGFNALRTHAAAGPIEIELQTGRAASDGPVSALEPDRASYTVSIEHGPDGPRVRSERIEIVGAAGNAAQRITLFDSESCRPEERADAGRLRLDQPDAVVLGALRNKCLSEADESWAITAVRGLRALLRGPYFSRVDATLAKQPVAATADHCLTECGGNLANAVKYQAAHNAERFQRAVQLVRRAAPCVEDIRTCDTVDGRVALEFVENGNGVFAQHISDGTIGLLAYALLLNEHERRPLLCIEQPDSGIYPSLMPDLYDELLGYTFERDAQVFVTTHRTELLNPADPQEVFWLTRNDSGSMSTHASDDPQIVAECNAGNQLGFMWRTGSFRDAHPQWR